MLSPIILFVYNRPDHTQKTLDALAKNDFAKDSILYVFCDGAKSNSSQNQLEKINETREVVKKQKEERNFKEVIITEQTQNLGLADSILSGVSQVIEKYGKVIVLEDDIVTSKGFLRFMNEGLEVYQYEEKVMHISGYMFPANLENAIPNDEQTFFYRSTSCWGWATWQRAWAKINTDTEFLLSELQSKNLLKEFDLDNTYQFSKQLEFNITKKIKTWAVKWYASVFLQNGLCLHPKYSLVQNIGTDSTGNTSPTTNYFWHNQLADYIEVNPISITENKKVVEQMKVYYKQFKLSFSQKIINRFRLFRGIK
ncbi:glycosyltransferase family A protein [Bernardetia sp. MNP-M8]|uniref:glycosyltransferase family 2 protein n=1 Tax=Bernardetia sp. MNP-M8 TaxID=3127470 RepID=UPI0030D3290F